MTEDWISITEAAARLTAAGDPIERSTLSRYLQQHAEALAIREAGKTRLVEFTALQAHRVENIRLKAPAGERGPPAQRQPSGKGRRFAGSQADGAARKASADAEMKELDLAERRKQLTPTAEVDRAGRDAIALLQSAFDQAVDTQSVEFAHRYGWDERQVRVALKGFARSGLDVFHRRMLEELDKMRGTGGAAEA